MPTQSGTDTRVLDRQIRLLYSQSSSAVMASVILAPLLAFYLWNEKNSAILVYWLLLTLLAGCSRLFLIHRFTLQTENTGDLSPWLHRHVLASFLGGSAWGVLGLLYDPAMSVEQQVLLLLVLTGVATSTISSYAAVLRCYFAFLVPLLTLVLVQLYLNDTHGSNYLSIIALIFGTFLIGIARSYNAQIRNTLRLAAEREVLQREVQSSSQQLQRSENDLHASERRFGQVLKSSLDGYWDWDITGNEIFFSPRYKEQLGFREHELPNLFSSWESRLHPEEREPVLANLDAYLANPTGCWEEKFRLRHKDGSYRWILARAVPSFDNQHMLTKLIGLHIDITDRIHAERKIDFLARYDWLTELPNRSVLIDRIELAIEVAKQKRSQLYLLVLDLDRFKHINDSLGHSAGDKALQIVSSRFSSLIDENNTIARLAGDEFAILIGDVTDVQQIIHLAETLLESLKKPLIIEQQLIYLSTSIGISHFPDDGEESTTLLKNADAAMHWAKSNGRNKFHFYSPELTESAFRQLKLEHGLRQALRQNQLQLYYQPKISLKTGQPLGGEALLRWQHPVDGFISPQDFIPVAEESGLILEIGQWVLHQACKEAAWWRRQGLKFQHVAVNVSGVQVQSSEFAGMVKEILDQTGLPAQLLELEVTENFLMKDAEASAALLGELRQLGISIAIDDFGTGYSSLAYLTRFPVNKLKIDRSFICKACEDSYNAEISRAIIALGHALSMEVVAEGIERQEQMDFLRDKGCDEGQGYLIAKPMAHDEFVAFLKRHGGSLVGPEAVGKTTTQAALS